MGAERQQAPLVAIVGETASGKSALALELAERYNGEIICADSRTVYKGTDIGTAKPSKEEQARIPHHLLNIVDPDQKYNVVNFQGLTLETIKNIGQRGKLAILCGGTGLYVDSVLYNLDFKVVNERDSLNPRHLSSAGFPSEGKELRPNTLVIGLSVPKEELEERITKRVNAMFEQGLEAEVKALARRYGWQAEAMSAVGYREWGAYFAGTQSLEQTRELIVIHTRQYAKRQRTWFKRNPHINWVDSAGAAQQIVMTFLQQNK
jgi:tRNA dimethylallyltransferase